MATCRDTSVDVMLPSTERSRSVETNEVAVADPPRIDRSTAENIQNERRERYAKAVKLDETLDAFLVRLRLTSGIDLEDQILKIFCTEDKKEGVEQALQVELRDVEQRLHPFVQVVQVDTEFSIERHKASETSKCLSTADACLQDGSISLKSVRSLFEGLSDYEIDRKLTGMCPDKGTFAVRWAQVNRYLRLQQHGITNQIIMQLKRAYSKQFTGDFDILQAVTEMDVSAVLSSMTREAEYTIAQLNTLDKDKLAWINAFTDAQPLIAWLQDEFNSPSELLTFLDTHILSSTNHSVIEIRKAINLMKVVNAFKPIIYELPPNPGLTDLLDKFRQIWNYTDTEKMRPEELMSLTKDLEWLKGLKRKYSSVGWDAISRMEEINSDGVYTVGNLHENTRDLDQMITVSVPREDEIEETYSYSDLQNLQNTLVLMAGQNDRNRNHVQRFSEVLNTVRGVTETFSKLCANGDILFEGWTSKFYCNKEEDVNTFINFGFASGILTGAKKEGYMLDHIKQVQDFMKDCLKDWDQHIQEQRDRFDVLNSFTTKQIVVLCTELSKVTEHGSEGVPDTIFPLLETVLPGCTRMQLQEAWLDTEKEMKSLYQEERSDHCDLYEREKEEVIQCLQLRGLHREQIISAMNENKTFDEEDLMLWCWREEDTVKSKGIVGSTVIKSEEAYHSSMANPLVTDSEQRTSLKGRLQKLWKKYLSTGTSTGFKDHLSIVHLGHMLTFLKDKYEDIASRDFPNFFHKGRPNLVLCKEVNVWKQVLSVYMYNADLPLPTRDEVLLCTQHTTAEDIQLLLMRVAKNATKIFTLVNIDQLSWKVAMQVEDDIQTILQGCSDYNLVMVCCSERKHNNPLIAALSTNLVEETIIYSTQEIRDYVSKHLTTNQPSTGGKGSANPYIFLNHDGHTMSFLGYNVNPDTMDVPDSETNVTRSSKRDVQLQRLCTVMGVDSYDPDANNVLTSDNIKQMLAFYVRFRCQMPVIVMGETGCGKTYLVDFLCGLQKPQDPDASVIKTRFFIKMNGNTTEQDLINEIRLAEAHANENHKLYPGLFSVVCLDTVNTTEALSLVKEILCDHTINGEYLDMDSGLQFVATCNPYKRHSKAMVQKMTEGHLGYHASTENESIQFGGIPMRHLVYNIEPLPQGLMPLVLDFGPLDDETEELYIRKIVHKHLESIPDFIDGDMEVIADIIHASQCFMRSRKDEGSHVSLRDPERVMVVMKWFLKNKIQLYRSSGDCPDVKVWSLVMSLSVCYHAALASGRSKYRDEIVKHFRGNVQLPKNDGETVANIIQQCQEMFVKDLCMDSTIAEYEALKEDVFMMAVCMELRIPPFNIGKPGSSKTLSQQILANELKGNSSKSDVFQRLKEVNMMTYQCSPLSTAEGIINMVKTCEAEQENNNLDEYVSVVVLDEIGLAEDTPKMPLQTLHHLLEDGRQGEEPAGLHKKAGFIGLSNWSLDSAKNNCAFAVRRNSPDGTKLKMIAESISEGNNGFHKMYRDTMKGSKHKEFFGLQDFYRIVKMLRGFSKEDDKTPNEDQMKRAIRSNFGGLPDFDPMAFFKNDHLFEEAEHLDPGGDEAISYLSIGDTNRQDPFQENHHLLSLTENHVIKERFEWLNNGDSSLHDLECTNLWRAVDRIKACMEMGETLIPLNQDLILESLYDVLKQNYCDYQRRNYVDAGLGSQRLSYGLYKDTGGHSNGIRPQEIFITAKKASPAVNILEVCKELGQDERDEKEKEKNLEQLKHSVRDTTYCNCSELHHPLRATKVVLVGQTGVGKSSLRNLLIGKSVFKTPSCMGPETSTMTPEEICMPTDVGAMTLKIFDTPGYFDCRNSDTMAIADALQQLTGGIHCFLFVVNSVRVTPEETDRLKSFLNVAGSDIRDRTILVFTHAQEDLRETSLLDYLKQATTAFTQNLLFRNVSNQVVLTQDGPDLDISLTIQKCLPFDRGTVWKGQREREETIRRVRMVREEEQKRKQVEREMASRQEQDKKTPFSNFDADWHDLFLDQKDQSERNLAQAYMERVVSQLGAWSLASI